MSGPGRKDEAENIFKIMDGIIDQLNKTKRMFILMVITIMVVIPVSFAISFAVMGPPFPVHGGPWDQDRSDPSNLWPVRTIPFVIALIWIGLGIRQWLILNRWTRKYELYRELQKKLDEKLGDKGEDNNRSA